MTAARGIGRGDVSRLRAAPRCGARTRRGTSCAAPRCHGRVRCRMHGGAAGSGAPVGNRNALKDGFYTAAARLRRRAMNAFIREMTAAVARLEREPVFAYAKSHRRPICHPGFIPGSSLWDTSLAGRLDPGTGAGMTVWGGVGCGMDLRSAQPCLFPRPLYRGSTYPARQPPPWTPGMGAGGVGIGTGGIEVVRDKRW